MGTTIKYALPYPELTDVANVPADMRELAEAVDTKMGAPGDTGWVAISVYPGFAAHTDPPMVRKIGSVVYARGAWASTGIGTGAGPFSVGLLPVGFRPLLIPAIGRCGTSAGGAAATYLMNANGGINIRSNGVASTWYYMPYAVWTID